MRFSLPHALDVLERTPGVLRLLLLGLPDEWTRRPYGEGTWSAFDVVSHLIHGEHDDWIPRVRSILAHGAARPFEPFIRAGHAAHSAGKSLPQLLDEFTRLRAASLEALRGLGLREADLDRPGLHPALGQVTLRNLLATWVVHDLNHIAQACKATAFQHRGEVGAWEAYLSVLSPPNPR